MPFYNGQIVCQCATVLPRLTWDDMVNADQQRGARTICGRCLREYTFHSDGRVMDTQTGIMLVGPTVGASPRNKTAMMLSAILKKGKKHCDRAKNGAQSDGTKPSADATGTGDRSDHPTGKPTDTGGGGLGDPRPKYLTYAERRRRALEQARAAREARARELLDAQILNQR